MHRFLHKTMDNEATDGQENEEYFDRMLQDPCAKPMPLTLDFLKGITNDFSEDNVLGRGGFGVVYKGVLRNGKAIAVKRLNIRVSNLSDEEYQRELRNLVGLRHKNVVQFKGHCADSSLVPWPESPSSVAEKIERVLCFEYLSNKSLHQHISDASGGLEWLVRYEIIKGICSGLHYLHMERDIAHMDLKPENILLDDNMVPKIADFGTSRLFGENYSRIFTQNFVLSRGYTAPEYIHRGMISKKADIFSFGVIILELLTGSRMEYPSSEEHFLQFTEDVVGKWRNRLPDAGCTQQVRACIYTALKCVDANPDRRPTTGDIIKMLNNEVQDPSSSGSRVQRILKISIGVGAVVLILSNPSSSWSWVVTALDFVTPVVTLCVVGLAALYLLVYLMHNRSSRPRVTLFTIGTILAAVLVIQNPPTSIILSTIGSWTAITLKFVIRAVTLFAIVVVVLLFFVPAEFLGSIILLVVLIDSLYKVISGQARAKDHHEKEEQERENV